MAGLLEGRIAKAIYKGFKGKLLKGTLTRVIESGGFDDNGDPVNVASQSYKFEGFVENFTSYYRSLNGIPDTDINVMIFAQSIGTVPTNDDRITVTRRGAVRHYQVRKMREIDPAEATYSLQCFEIK